jgi:hypothetical protein
VDIYKFYYLYYFLLCNLIKLIVGNSKLSFKRIPEIMIREAKHRGKATTSELCSNDVRALPVCFRLCRNHDEAMMRALILPKVNQSQHVIRTSLGCHGEAMIRAKLGRHPGKDLGFAQGFASGEARIKARMIRASPE